MRLHKFVCETFFSEKMWFGRIQNIMVHNLSLHVLDIAEVASVEKIK